MGTTLSSVDTIKIIQKSIHLDGIICLSKRESGDSISGYVYIPDECGAMDIPFIEVDSYNLESEEDKKKILGEHIDILLVCGWQRLIPSWLIEHTTFFCLGGHGSPWGIANGRGRAPQNWALLLGKTEFYLSLFILTPGIDDGDIVEERIFTYDITDDINISYKKVSLLLADMFSSFIDKLYMSRIQRIAQKKDAYYLPQRLPEDGMIDWYCSSMSLYNFIRGLTHPYPCAFTILDKKKIKIVKAKLFSFRCHEDAIPGQIVHVFHDGEFIVRTGDGNLLITEYLCEKESIKDLKIFESADSARQMNLIIKRHLKKYPDKKIVPELFGYVLI